MYGIQKYGTEEPVCRAGMRPNQRTDWTQWKAEGERNWESRIDIYAVTLFSLPTCCHCSAFSTREGMIFLIQRKLQEQQIPKAFTKNKGAPSIYQSYKDKQLGENSLKVHEYQRAPRILGARRNHPKHE